MVALMVRMRKGGVAAAAQGGGGSGRGRELRRRGAPPRRRLQDPLSAAQVPPTERVAEHTNFFNSCLALLLAHHKK